MAKNLVIVESPAKCRTISKYLGSDHVVKATMGHIIDLPEKELGVDIKAGFKPKYVIAKGKRRVCKILREEAAKAQTVFLAPDPDREGEAIAWHVAQTIVRQNKNVKRVTFNEITKKAVLAAFANPSEIDMHKVNAQQARRILDRIVGYQVSPLLWRTVYRGLSAGRVQSVALRLICEREDAIKAFKQEEYWSIQAVLDHPEGMLRAKLHSIDGNKVSLPNQASAKAITESLRDAQFSVVDVQKTEKVRRPAAPFITSTLQQDASRKLGFTAAKTMMIAQQLYEGLELGTLGSTGLITYMRTDSTRVADEAAVAARLYIADAFGAQYIADEPRIYGKSRNAQDAHEAIRPVQISGELSPEKVRPYLSYDQFRLYELIWKRFLASQMANALFDTTRVDISADRCIFRALGSRVKFDGFLSIYEESTDEKTDNGEDTNDQMPDVKIGEVLRLRELIEKQHFTQPPPRYTEASLVRELEERGIGRPSTYAQIIDTLKNRRYVMMDAKRFVPTEVAYMVKNILVREFPDIFETGFTANMEAALDKIEEGTADWVEILRRFYDPFLQKLESAKQHIQQLRSQSQEVTEKKCPKCGKFSLVVKWSRNGRFYACQGFPACRHTEPVEKPAIAGTNEKCDKCGAPLVVLELKNNRFLGCSRYPECKFTKPLTTGVKCPREGCSGVLAERKTRRGKVFFGCSAYPACSFATWDRPVARSCEQCGFSIMIQRDTKRKGIYLRCPHCRAEVAIAGAEGEQQQEKQL